MGFTGPTKRVEGSMQKFFAVSDGAMVNIAGYRPDNAVDGIFVA
jgi:hypothetical protein